jgi:(p)ppGpp synthase/HD superfamily hydrolase
MTAGYSDRINHAFAFAAKHHDQQVRKGTRLPYLTHAPNVAVILTRYGQDEETVLAGILHDVVEDCVREGEGEGTLSQRLADKFGDETMATAVAIVERRFDDDGIEMSSEERKSDLLERLAVADERSRWVFTADLVHTSGTLLSDLARTTFPETVWSRFSLGREGTVAWYRRAHERLIALEFGAPIVAELGAMVERLEASSASMGSSRKR